MARGLAVSALLVAGLAANAEAQTCWGVKSFERADYDSVTVVMVTYPCDAEMRVDTLRFRAPVEARATKEVEVKRLVAAPFPQIEWGEKERLNLLTESISRLWYGVIPGESLLVGFEWGNLTYGYAFGPKRAFIGFTFRAR